MKNYFKRLFALVMVVATVSMMSLTGCTEQKGVLGHIKSDDTSNAELSSEEDITETTENVTESTTESFSEIVSESAIEENSEIEAAVNHGESHSTATSVSETQTTTQGELATEKVTSVSQGTNIGKRTETETTTAKVVEVTYSQTTPVTVYANCEVNQRSGPSESYKVVAVASKGNAFIRVGVGSNGWWKLKRIDGTIVYSYGSHYQLTKIETETTANTNTNTNTNTNNSAKTSYVNVTTQHYSYAEVVADMKALVAKYPDKLTMKSFGTTLDGDTLYYLIVGKVDAPQTVVISSTIHAREYVASVVTMYSLEYTLNNWNVTAFDNTNIYYIPMLNPDGVAISQLGPNGIKSVSLRNAILNMGCTDYSLWKANANGVDLNRHFSYGWGNKAGASGPRYQYFKGFAAETEPEVKALINLTNSLGSKFKAFVSFHSSGNEIFWNCGETGDLKTKTLALANAIKGVNGSRLNASYSCNYGLETDYYLKAKGVPAVTVELGVGAAPVSYNTYSGLINRNNNIMLTLANLY